MLYSCFCGNKKFSGMIVCLSLQLPQNLVGNFMVVRLHTDVVESHSLCGKSLGYIFKSFAYVLITYDF